MSASKTMSNSSFGFMTVADLGNAALIGGYLVLNCLGRPLEFHCTEPVKANRAQEILYGPTLRSFLCGEQIGQALLRHCQLETELILTDSQAVLSLRDFTDIPVLCVVSPPGWPSDVAPGHNTPSRTEETEEGAGAAGQPTNDPFACASGFPGREPIRVSGASNGAAGESRWHSFWLAKNEVYISTRYLSDQQRAERIYRERIPEWDLWEPFQRIGEAVRELQKAA